MSFFRNYRTPFGYVADGNQVDAYGVDHSGFSTRDEVEYQFARQEREKQMADNLKQQGIEPENYPQLGNLFWGNNSENNYGFGTSNISVNIENKQNQTPQPNVGNINQNIWNGNQYQTPTPWAKQRESMKNNLSSQQNKTVYENPNPRRFSTGEILWDGVKGFGQGMIGGIEHGINTMSLGLYDVINDAFFDAGYEKRQKELENLAANANLDKAYKYSNYIIDAAVGALPFNKVTKKISPVVSRIYQKIK